MITEKRKQEFVNYLFNKNKKQLFIDMSMELVNDFHHMLGDEVTSSRAIDAFVRNRWSGYVSRDRATYQILEEYANFFERELPAFSDAFHKHVRETFEGEARKAMRVYKDTLVFIPPNAKIAPFLLGKLTNGQFIEAYKSLQNLIYEIYDDIEHGSPFDWGWLDWRAITGEGINHNRVMMVFGALVESSCIENDMLIVDKKIFYQHNICKPIANIKLMFKKFSGKGFLIEEFDNKQSAVFRVSYPRKPNLITVLHTYFNRGYGNNSKYTFSYRFVEDPTVQSREAFFLAQTDGEPLPIREIYFWLYDEAVKYGFVPMGFEKMGCYVYKKESQEWLLLGNGSSYHEDEFLHSVNYKLAVKTRFYHVFQTHQDKIGDLMKRFPSSFGRPWTQCFMCKKNSLDCKYRINFKLSSNDYYHCAKHHYLYFHDPNFDDVKVICELFKLENNIK